MILRGGCLVRVLSRRGGLGRIRGAEDRGRSWGPRRPSEQSAESRGQVSTETQGVRGVLTARRRVTVISCSAHCLGNIHRNKKVPCTLMC